VKDSVAWLIMANIFTVVFFLHIPDPNAWVFVIVPTSVSFAFAFIILKDEQLQAKIEEERVWRLNHEREWGPE